MGDGIEGDTASEEETESKGKESKAYKRWGREYERARYKRKWRWW